MMRSLLAVLLILVSQRVFALSDGPRFGGAEASCSFLSGAGCGEADGPNDNLCDFASGAAQSVVLGTFGFNLPASVTSIDGIVVEAKNGHDSCLPSARLVKAGTPVGNTKSLGGPMTLSCAGTTFTTLGDATDTWGVSWTAADVNATGFGVQILNNGCTAVGVDAVRITVHFSIDTPVCGDGYQTGGEACDDGNTNRGDGCSSECQIEGALDVAGQKCVVALNKDAAKIAQAVSKVESACFKAVATGKSGTFVSCDVLDTPGGGPDKAAAKFAADVAKRCAPVPAFGLADTSAATTAATDAYRALLLDVHGTPPAIAPKGDPEADCQAVVQKRLPKLLATELATFTACKQSGLAGKTLPQIISGADLEACRQAGLDPKGKIAKAVAGIVTELGKKNCEAVLLAAAFPGECATGTNAALAACIGSRTACRACLLENGVDGISIDCDAADDGIANASCP